MQRRNAHNPMKLDHLAEGSLHTVRQLQVEPAHEVAVEIEQQAHVEEELLEGVRPAARKRAACAEALILPRILRDVVRGALHPDLGQLDAALLVVHRDGVVGIAVVRRRVRAVLARLRVGLPEGGALRLRRAPPILVRDELHLE